MRAGHERHLRPAAAPFSGKPVFRGPRGRRTILHPEPHRTDANFAAFQTVSADNHPIHYDIEYCRERGHPGPLAHGFQVLCFTAAGAGTFAHVIGDLLIAFIEQSSKFLKPVYPGDTLYPNLTIAALTPQRTTGVVTVAVTVHNQKNELVLTGEQKYLLKKRGAA